MTRTKTFLVVALFGGLAAAAGSAVTASNTMPGSSVGGFGTVTVSGATVESIDYTQSADGTQITAATVVLTGDVSAKDIKAGFGTTAPTSCTATYSLLTSKTTASCTGFTQAISSASAFNVAVTD